MTPAPARHRLVERSVLLCLAVLFVAMMVVAYGYSLRDALGPGPGFFPFWLGLLGVLCAAALIAHSFRGRSIGDGEETHWPDRSGAKRALVLLVGLLAAALLLDALGFRLTMLALSTALLLGLGARRPLPIVVFALAASFGLFHVFYHWLKVPLPIGVAGF